MTNRQTDTTEYRDESKMEALSLAVVKLSDATKLIAEAYQTLIELWGESQVSERLNQLKRQRDLAGMTIADRAAAEAAIDQWELATGKTYPKSGIISTCYHVDPQNQTTEEL